MTRRMRASPEEIKQRLRGPVTSIPTPFAADESIDWDGVAGIIELALRADFHTILLTAGDSQFQYLKEDEIAGLTRFVIERVAGRALTVAATGEWVTRQSVAFAEYCRDLGADLLMSLPPAQITTGIGLAAHYKRLAAVMPVMLVGYPAHEVLDRLLDEPAICCFKEDGTEAYAVQLLQKYGRRWRIMTGGALWRHLLEWPFGAEAFMDWFTSIAPAVTSQYWRAIQSGDLAEARRITIEIEKPVFDLAARQDTRFGVHMLWRAMLEIKGVAKRYLRLPHPSASPAQVDEARALMTQLGIL